MSDGIPGCATGDHLKLGTFVIRVGTFEQNDERVCLDFCPVFQGLEF